MKVKTKKTYGAWWGLIFGIIVFSFCIWGVNFSLSGEDRILKLLIELPIYLFLGIFILLLIGAFNTYYEMNDSEFRIVWGFYKVSIPWENVTGVVNVQGASNLFSIFGASWPGYIVGLYSAKGLGTVKMYGTNPNKGFIYLKTDKGFFGLTPEDTSLHEKIAAKSGVEVEVVDMDKVPLEIKGKSLMKDPFYRLMFILNIIFILAFALYLTIFFPGSGAPKFIILLLVLAVGLFFFNISNAARLFQFSDSGGYILLALGIAITGTFFILSLSEISLK